MGKVVVGCGGCCQNDSRFARFLALFSALFQGRGLCYYGNVIDWFGVGVVGEGRGCSKWVWGVGGGR